MTLNELLKDENFLRLLDEENSKEIALYLSNLRSQEEINTNVYKDLTKMFKDIGIYQDVYMYYRMPLDEKIKYITTGAMLFPENKTLDLRNKVLASSSITGPKDCKLVLDSTIELLDNMYESKWDAPINIRVRDYNEIQINSLPEGLIFVFGAHRDSLEINTKFKISKNITNFKEFLEKQTFSSPYSAYYSKKEIISMILKNTEWS